MRTASFKSAPLLASLVLAAGCASSRVQPAAAGPVDYVCERGNPVLVVRNASGREVEIVETRIGSAGRAVIAVVGNGRHEVRIRNESRFAYAAQPVGGGTVYAVTSRGRVRERTVLLEKACRD